MGLKRLAFLLVWSVAPAATMVTSVAPAGAQPAPTGARLVRVANSLSTNWSGYASTDGPFTSVSASWVQPSVSCPRKGSYYSSFWVGIDGDGSSTVEQTGSEADCHNGRPSYYSWYEMYPAYPVNFSNPVQPGDAFAGSVSVNGSTFTLTLSDKTQGWTQTESLSSTSAQKYSAEVIAEAPSSGGRVLPLADFGTVNFNSSVANSTAIGKLNPDAITMVTNKRTVKAQPSALDSTGENFSVTWYHS